MQQPTFIPVNAQVLERILEVLDDAEVDQWTIAHLQDISGHIIYGERTMDRAAHDIDRLREYIHTQLHGTIRTLED